MNYCQNCGIIIKPEWKVCPNCGGKVQEEDELSQSSQIQPNTSRPKFSFSRNKIYKPINSSPTSNLFGIIAVIFVLFGFIMVITIPAAGLVLGILAISFGIIGWIRDDVPIIAGIGLFIGITLSFLGIFLLVISAIL